MNFICESNFMRIFFHLHIVAYCILSSVYFSVFYGWHLVVRKESKATNQFLYTKLRMSMDSKAVAVLLSRLSLRVHSRESSEVEYKGVRA